MRDMLREAVGAAAGTAQLRYHRRKSLQIRVENGVLKDIVSNVIAGVGVRVLHEGVWGFSCTSELTKDGVNRSLKEAIEAAKSAEGLKAPLGPLAVNPVTGALAVKETRPFDNVPLEEKTALVRRTGDKMRAISNKSVSVSVAYGEIIDDKIIVTSYGADVSYHDAKGEFRAQAVSSGNGRFESGGVRLGATGGWGELFRHHNPEEIPEQAVKSAVEKLNAEVPAGGVYTVVLHPSLVGILAHEAIGHTVEADFVLSGSIAARRLNQKVAAETITLVDDPLPGLDYAAAGVLLVDDEGNQPVNAVIIENGILKGYLHDAETASLFGVPNTGNGRAFTYRDEPIVRMRNTYVMPGKDNPAEMIASLKEGLYLQNLGMSGQADANAEFMFDVGDAWRIENGKIGKRLKGVTISGQAFEVLSSVDRVGNDFLLDTGAGHCGKHQLARVDGGGPHIRCKMKIGGSL